MRPRWLGEELVPARSLTLALNIDAAPTSVSATAAAEERPPQECLHFRHGQELRGKIRQENEKCNRGRINDFFTGPSP